MGWYQGRSGCFEEEKNLLHPPGIESQFHGHPQVTDELLAAA